MKTTRLIFTLAGIYGLLILTPFLVLERKVAELTPGGMTQPEYYYGFVDAALVMQLVYLTIGRDPVRYRPLMPCGMFEKFSFVIALIVLWLKGRAPAIVLGLAAVDGLLGVLFVLAYAKTKE